MEEGSVSSDKLPFFIDSPPRTINDTLGRSFYAHAMARFLTHKETKGPLYISIQAPWGAGKSTFMKLVQDELDPKAFNESPGSNNDDSKDKATVRDIRKLLKDLNMKKDQKTEKKIPQFQFKKIQCKGKIKRCITVSFDAVMYDGTEQVWAGLSDSIVRYVALNLQQKQRDIFLFLLHIRRLGLKTVDTSVDSIISNYSQQKTRLRIWGSIIGFATSALIAIVARPDNKNVFTDIGLGGIAIAVGIPLVQTFIQYYNTKDRQAFWNKILNKISGVEHKYAEEIFPEYIGVPCYSKKSVSTDDAEEELLTILRIIPEDYLPLGIFIDNVDRCSPHHIASVMEAIYVSLPKTFPNCMFVLSMDTDAVVAALGEAPDWIIERLFKHFTSRARANWQLMDKLAQIPFVMPLVEDVDRKKYWEDLLSTFESQTKLENNHVKQNYDEAKEILNDASDAKQNSNGGYGFKDGQEHDHSNNKERSVQVMDSVIDNYSNRGPLREMILKAAREISLTNPLVSKRFLDMFRLDYFMRAARSSMNKPVSSLEQLRDWIVLSLKWPEAVRWLWRSPNFLSTVKEPNIDINNIRKNLQLLESLGEECNNGHKDWKSVIKLHPELEPTSNRWITDQDLGDFFQYQGSLSRSKRLSAAAETGLY